MSRINTRLSVILAAALLTAWLPGVTPAHGQSRSNVLDPTADPRGPVDLTVCSQNLENYGLLALARERTPGMNAERMAIKERAIAARVAKAQCDIIAVQEVLGKSEDESLEALSLLGKALQKTTNRVWGAVTGPSNDPATRVGYLYALDRGDVVTKTSYSEIELPRLLDNEKPRGFTRGPLEIQFAAKGRGESAPRTVVLVTFHFKSKRGGAGDPAQLEWETYRMEMAEALRRIVVNRHERAFESGETLLVVLGDRNSNFDAASAKILDGTLRLNVFKGDGVCRLSKRGVPLCQQGAATPQKLFSPLVSDPQTKQLQGTHRYKKEYSWLDEILMPAPSLRAAWTRYDSEGDYDSGVIYDPREASDHAMTYVRLNW